MAADSDDIDLGTDTDGEPGGAPKKRGGLGNFLPTILKFAAIGIGALIFIVTVSMITYNFMNKRGGSQTVISDPLSPYIGKRPEYMYFDQIGVITTRTKDTLTSSTVSVEVIIGYDMNDQNATMELIGRKLEIIDFIRRYFTGKYSSELLPEKEDELKNDICEQLNTRFLDAARARIILFKKLDVMETF